MAAPTAERGAQLLLRERASAKSLRDCLFRQFLGDVRPDGVHYRAEWPRDWYGATPSNVGLLKVPMMKNDSPRHAQPAAAPRIGNGHVDLGRKDIREFKERERGVMAERAVLAGPKPGNHEIFVLSRWEMNQPKDPPARALNLAVTKVVLEKLSGVSGLSGLLGGEVTVLRRR
jgi:hypothetical protein